jgi:hypothetical protein
MPGSMTVWRYTVREGATQLVERVVRTGALDAGMTVDYATTNGSAVAGSDYEAVSGTLFFGEGQSEQPIPVPILNDVWYEGTESFQLTLTNPAAGPPWAVLAHLEPMNLRRAAVSAAGGVLSDRFREWAGGAVDAPGRFGCVGVEQLLVSCQRQERPTVPVHVVLQIEHFRKAGAGDFILAPRAVGILGADQVVDAALDAGPMRVIERAQAHERPGGL